MSMLPQSWSRRLLLGTVLMSSTIMLILVIRAGAPPEHDDLEATEEMVAIYDRYPVLRHVQNDLIAGKTNLAQAVELAAPLVEGRLREAVIYRGQTLERGVAMMLVAWVEQQSVDEPGSVSPAILRRLRQELDALPEMAKGPETVPMKG